jgi:hypothetical protein
LSVDQALGYEGGLVQEAPAGRHRGRRGRVFRR